MESTRKNRQAAAARALFPRDTGLASDLRHFLLARPRVDTRVPLEEPGQRERYGERILQRLGIRVDRFAVLNIHRIGIRAPVDSVFEVLLRWGIDAPFWPNRIAAVERQEQRLDHMRVLLLGREELPFGLGDKLLGFRVVPLFRLTALRIQETPAEPDGAHYLLYECSGGYPIGFLALYVRSRIEEEGERAPSQLFFGVGFNFYGRRRWSRRGPVRALWEIIHDRVTANVLNRIKRICERETIDRHRPAEVPQAAGID